MEKLGYSPDEAADALGVGRNLIFAALRDGRLERRKAGSRTVIPAASLQQFLASLPTSRPPTEAAA